MLVYSPLEKLVDICFSVYKIMLRKCTLLCLLNLQAIINSINYIFLLYSMASDCQDMVMVLLSSYQQSPGFIMPLRNTLLKSQSSHVKKCNYLIFRRQRA